MRTSKKIMGRLAIVAAASAALSGGLAFAGSTAQPSTAIPVPGNTNGNKYATISLSGSTALRNYTVSAGFSELPANTTIFLSSGTFTAPSSTFLQLAPTHPNDPGSVTGGVNDTTDVAANRIEWHEQGSVEGILELARDQIFGSTLPGDAPLSLTAAGSAPTASNPVWINRATVAADNTSNSNGWAYGTTGPNGGNNGQSPVQLGISDVKPIQGFSTTGTASYLAKPGSSGYGLGNPQAVYAGESSGLGVLGSRQALVLASDLNANGRVGGIANLTSNTVAITASTFSANPGTGLTNLSQNDAQFLQLTGRFANGATFEVTTRDVNSGTRSSVADNTGIDPSWAVGVNDGGNALVTTLATATSADNQDAINRATVTALDGTSIPNSTIRFSGKTAGGLVRTTIANGRMAIGTLSLPDALSGAFSGNGNSSTLATVNTPINILNYQNVTPTATTITNGTYIIWQQEQYITVKSATVGIQGDTLNTSAPQSLGSTTGGPVNISGGVINFGTGSTFKGGFVVGQTISAAGVAAGATVTNVILNPSGTVQAVDLSDPNANSSSGTFTVSGGDVANFQSNVLDAVRIAGGTVGFTTTTNPGDTLATVKFILPQLMQVAKPYDGGPVTSVTDPSHAYDINTNPNGYNDSLRTSFLGTSTAKSGSAPGLFFKQPTSSAGYYGAATRGAGQPGSGITAAAPQVLFTNGGIAITSSSYLFGNFANTGSRDFNSFQFGVAALSALYNSGLGVDAFDTTGASGATAGTTAVSNSNVLTNAQLNNSGSSFAAVPLAATLGTGSSFSGQRGDSTYVNASTGTITPYAVNASYGTVNTFANGATKGDLIVMGDYNGDGRFDGQDIYAMAIGTALSDSTGTTTLTAGNYSSGVLRKNDALNFVQSGTTDASYNTSTGFAVANNASGFIRQSARVILSSTSGAPIGTTPLYNSTSGSVTKTFFTYDPKGDNAFNKTDVNRDGVVDFNDVVLVDNFSGQSYNNAGQVLSAAQQAPVTGTSQAANLVLLKQVDNGTTTIGGADFNTANGALTGIGTTNWYGYNLAKTGSGNISFQRSGGAVNVYAKASLQISGGSVQVMSAIDPFTDNANYGQATNNTSSSVAITVGSGAKLQYTGTSTTGIQLERLSSLNISGGGLVTADPVANHSNRILLVTGGTSLATTGTLDLGNSDMVVQNGSLSNINAAVKAGYNGGSYNASGITSFSAANSPTHLTTLGVIQNNQSGSAVYTAANQFDGITPGAGDVLVKYTYYGDANLDGVVDASDYSRIDNGFLSQSTTSPLSGWYNGDFNYDGVVDGSDYTLIDNTFNVQGASLAAAISSPTVQIAAQIAGTSAVPEPTTLGLLGLGMGSLLGRRRRRA